MTCYYFDSSAIAKLVVNEAESGPLRDLASPEDLWMTCDLARTEVMRSVTRRESLSAADVLVQLQRFRIISLDRDVYEMAGRIQPARLRSLDAIHVAAALSLGSDLTALVTYDARMAEAARLNGLAVLSPGLNGL